MPSQGASIIPDFRNFSSGWFAILPTIVPLVRHVSRKGKSAASPSGLGDAALQRILAGSQRLPCGTNWGRNCLSNHALSPALSGMHCIFALCDDPAAHCEPRFERPRVPNFFAASAVAMTVERTSCRMHAKEQCAYSARFQWLESWRPVLHCVKPGIGFALEHCCEDR